MGRNHEKTFMDFLTLKTVILFTGLLFSSVPPSFSEDQTECKIALLNWIEAYKTGNIESLLNLSDGKLLSDLNAQIVKIGEEETSKRILEKGEKKKFEDLQIENINEINNATCEISLKWLDSYKQICREKFILTKTEGDWKITTVKRVGK